MFSVKIFAGVVYLVVEHKFVVCFFFKTSPCWKKLWSAPCANIADVWPMGVLFSLRIEGEWIPFYSTYVFNNLLRRSCSRNIMCYLVYGSYNSRKTKGDDLRVDIYIWFLEIVQTA